jgi:exodeoxyribonuclease V beta subunit
MTVRRVARPPILERIPPDRPAVIEASAGTGKTFTLEHLVVDLLLGTDVTLDQILVVTFTEKATNELRARVRATLDRLADTRAASPELPAGAPAWTIDDRARERLLAARGAFESATITTIHAFCQRVLRDNAFFSGRLFEETQVDGRDAFGRAFRDALRCEVAPHAERAAWLEAALRGGLSIDELEELLWSSTAARGDVRPLFDERALRAAIEAFPDFDPDDAGPIGVLRAAGIAANSAGPMVRKVYALGAAVLASRAERSTARFVQLAGELEAPTWVEKIRDRKLSGSTGALFAAGVALLDATPTFEAALAHVVLPTVRARLDRRKRDAGQYDFDDMLSRVDEALGGPSGPALAAALRRRWRHVLIDEFQDTDEIQWRIFRRGFFDALPEPAPGRSVVYLVGDPKQSIYRFRGADVDTYLDARRAVEEARGTRVALDASYRATPAMVDALNAIFDPTADEPVFDGAVQYAPVTCAVPTRALVDAQGRAVAPVHLFRTEGTPGIEKIGPLIAREIAALTAEGRRWKLDGKDLALSDVFVLTRNRFEGRMVGDHLRRAGIPYAFFKEDGLFQTDEARDVAALLRAIEDPTDRARRFAAWLTPFFGLSLVALEDARELPPSHPYVARLATWRALADARDYGRLFESIVRESGLVRREIFFEESERELTNYLHIFELLLEHARRTRGTLREIVLEITGLIDRRRRPLDLEGDVQRIESEKRAVQIMTIHKAKGLEAAVVFVAGGASRGRTDVAHVYHEGGERLAWLGAPGLAVKDAIRREEREEEARLMYVALTRAKARLYLPCAVKGLGPHTLSGPYQVVNRRLVTLAREGAPWLTVEDVDPARTSLPAEAPAAPHPAPPSLDLLAHRVPQLRFDELREAHAGTFVTSYTRMRSVRARAARGGSWVEQADARRAEKAAGAVDASQSGALPGSRTSGVFLHELLERVPVATFAAAATFEAWWVRPDVGRLLDEAIAVHRVDRGGRERAARMVWAAYTTPVALPDGRRIDGLAKADRLTREMDFVYPLPGSPLGLVRGSLDLAFEVGERTYFVDWKSDTLPSYAPEALEKHTRSHYEDQIRLYAIAVSRLLGADGERAHERRFGGIVYSFLRGIDGSGRGLWSSRPGWGDIVRWQRELEEHAGWGAAAAVRSP